MDKKPIFRFPIYFVKNYEHLLEVMSEGNLSVKDYLSSLDDLYVRVEMANKDNKILQRNDGVIFNFDDIDFHYKKLLEFESDFAKVLKKSTCDESKKFQETIIFALDKMNMRGNQLQYLLYDYTNCDISKLLETISEPLCRKRAIQAVNINSAKRGDCDCAVEDKYKMKEYPLLTDEQLTWYPNVPEYTYKSKKEIELENAKISKKPNTKGFSLV